VVEHGNAPAPDFPDEILDAEHVSQHHLINPTFDPGALR
jgi:hypothetical protein